MNQSEIKQKVEEKISVLISDFRRTPEKFLTEEDIRAYLYHLLLTDFNNLEQTEDKQQSIPLHCEVRWYGSSKKLKYRSDIVIFDVSQLITKKGGNIPLPSKGYGFNNPNAIIEIKLRRINGKSNNKFNGDLVADRNKLKELKNKVVEEENEVWTYLIAFDKKNNINFQLENTEKHKEYYVYSSAQLTQKPNKYK
ncbi:MAG: hypothetical protein KKB39_03530 [Nanoarchaeota archaeon]|nr:hypothetical protein [Nanoarchaeota archaeon]